MFASEVKGQVLIEGTKVVHIGKLSDRQLEEARQIVSRRHLEHAMLMTPDMLREFQESARKRDEERKASAAAASDEPAEEPPFSDYDSYDRSTVLRYGVRHWDPNVVGRPCNPTTIADLDEPTAIELHRGILDLTFRRDVDLGKGAAGPSMNT